MAVKLKLGDVTHIAYSSRDPETPVHNGLRVSYKPVVGVIVTKWHSGLNEYHDTDLSRESLRVLIDLVPWLWRPKLAKEFIVETNLTKNALLPSNPRRLRAIFYEDSELGYDTSEDGPGVYVSARYEKKNRAEEWVSTDSDPLDLETEHLLWWYLIEKLQSARAVQDKLEIESSRKEPARLSESELRKALFPDPLVRHTNSNWLFDADHLS